MLIVQAVPGRHGFQDMEIRPDPVVNGAAESGDPEGIGSRSGCDPKNTKIREVHHAVMGDGGTAQEGQSADIRPHPEISFAVFQDIVGDDRGKPLLRRNLLEFPMSPWTPIKSGVLRGDVEGARNTQNETIDVPPGDLLDGLPAVVPFHEQSITRRPHPEFTAETESRPQTGNRNGRSFQGRDGSVRGCLKQTSGGDGKNAVRFRNEMVNPFRRRTVEGDFFDPPGAVPQKTSFAADPDVAFGVFGQGSQGNAVQGFGYHGLQLPVAPNGESSGRGDPQHSGPVHEHVADAVGRQPVAPAVGRKRVPVVSGHPGLCADPDESVPVLGQGHRLGLGEALFDVKKLKGKTLSLEGNSRGCHKQDNTGSGGKSFHTS